MYSVLDTDPRFRAPFGAIVCGPTMSGKSVWVSRFLEARTQLIDKPINRIVYCYGEWQPAFAELQEAIGPALEFHKGLGKIFEESFFDPLKHTLLILDDLGQEISTNPRASQMFTQGIHHRNVSIMLIIQNLYKQGKSMRDIHLNCQYLILFRNCRDVNQIKLLSRQMGLTHLQKAYENVTSEAFQPLVIDMRPNTPSYLRVRSHISPEQYMRIYVDESSALPCHKTSSS